MECSGRIVFANENGKLEVKGTGFVRDGAGNTQAEHWSRSKVIETEGE